MEIKTTKNYSIFKKLEGNRNVNRKHVKKLIQSMNKKYIPTVILVNNQYQVIDGQHRLEAMKTLNIPVTYTIMGNYNSDDAEHINLTNRTWNIEEICNKIAYYDNIDDYKILLTESKRYKVNITYLAKIMTLKENAKKLLITKKFTITNNKWEELLMLMKTYNSNCQQAPTKFINQILISKNPIEVMDRLIHKHTKVPVVMYEKSSLLRASIQEVYNHGLKNKISLFI